MTEEAKNHTVMLMLRDFKILYYFYQTINKEKYRYNPGKTLFGII